MVNGVGLQAELTCLSRDCVDPRSAPCGLPTQQCHPRETLTWRHRASRIGLLRKQLVIENLRLPETEVDGELNATRDAPGTARSTRSGLQVDRTVPVRTLWLACSKMPSKGNPNVGVIAQAMSVCFERNWLSRTSGFPKRRLIVN